MLRCVHVTLLIPQIGPDNLSFSSSQVRKMMDALPEPPNQDFDSWREMASFVPFPASPSRCPLGQVPAGPPPSTKKKTASNTKVKSSCRPKVCSPSDCRSSSAADFMRWGDFSQEDHDRQRSAREARAAKRTRPSSPIASTSAAAIREPVASTSASPGPSTSAGPSTTSQVPSNVRRNPLFASASSSTVVIPTASPASLHTLASDCIATNFPAGYDIYITRGGNNRTIEVVKQQPPSSATANSVDSNSVDSEASTDYEEANP